MGPRRRAVGWTEAARQQLDEALAYVADESAETAARLLDRILERGESLQVLSERGRWVPETGRESIRETLVDPFRLIYEVRESEVIVLAVLHQRQDFAGRIKRNLQPPDAP